MKKLLLALAVIIVISCSLERSNPLDPSASGHPEPSRVSGIEIDNVGNDYVYIEWNEVNNANGYYIYRSETFFGHYIKNKIITSNGTTSYDDYEVPELSLGNFYWYKMSAYRIADGDTLEGYRSDPKSWN